METPLFVDSGVIFRHRFSCTNDQRKPGDHEGLPYRFYRKNISNLTVGDGFQDVPNSLTFSVTGRVGTRPLRNSCMIGLVNEKRRWHVCAPVGAFSAYLCELLTDRFDKRRCSALCSPASRKKAVTRLPPPENVFVEPLPCWAGKKET